MLLYSAQVGGCYYRMMRKDRRFTTAAKENYFNGVDHHAKTTKEALSQTLNAYAYLVGFR